MRACWGRRAGRPNRRAFAVGRFDDGAERCVEIVEHLGVALVAGRGNAPRLVDFRFVDRSGSRLGRRLLRLRIHAGTLRIRVFGARVALRRRRTEVEGERSVQGLGTDGLSRTCALRLYWLGRPERAFGLRPTLFRRHRRRRPITPALVSGFGGREELRRATPAAAGGAAYAGADTLLPSFCVCFPTGRAFELSTCARSALWRSLARRATRSPQPCPTPARARALAFDLHHRSGRCIALGDGRIDLQRRSNGTHRPGFALRRSEISSCAIASRRASPAQPTRRRRVLCPHPRRSC